MIDVIFALVLAIAAAIALSVLLFQAITGVPPLSATRSEAANVVALLHQAGLQEHPVIYDLGSGWGSLVVALARAFPEARIIGIEWSPLPHWIARLRTRDLPNVHLHRGHFHGRDISDAHAVTCYLMMKPMPRLAGFLDSMLRDRTPVVALAFWFRGREPSAVRGTGASGAALYHWRRAQNPG